MEHATKPIKPLLSCSNYSRLLATNFDADSTVADDVHLWQESIRQIHARAFAYNILPIFQIPDAFDIRGFDSPNAAT